MPGYVAQGDQATLDSFISSVQVSGSAAHLLPKVSRPGVVHPPAADPAGPVHPADQQPEGGKSS